MKSIRANATTRKIGYSLLTWAWTKKLLYWVILSAGTMSELVFLVASLWMSINSSVHPLVKMVLSDDKIVFVSNLSTAAYVALPECILGLAFVTVISHVRVWLYDRSNISELVWSVLYGLPTLVFLVLSLFTLGHSVASSSTSTVFTMPEPLVVIRALAGYMYAFTSLLHMQLGEPQQRDRLAKKDTLIAALHLEYKEKLATLEKQKDNILAALQTKTDVIIAALNKDKVDLQAVIENQKGEIERLKTDLHQTINAQSELLKAVNKSDDAALEAYGEECIAWLKRDHKTVSLEEITRYTGHSKRKIEGAINKGLLRTATRNKELVMVDSLTIWLKTTPVSIGKTEDMPLLHIVNG